MYQVSQAFRDAVRGSHTAVSWVEILGAGENVDGWSDARVKMEALAAIRSTFSMTVLDPVGRYVDRGRPDDLLSRFGSEVRPWRGVRYDNGTIEAVPLGTFRIEGNAPVEAGSGFQLTITGRDRSAIVSRRTPRSIAVMNGTPINEAIMAIVRVMLPSARFNLVEVPEVTGTMLIQAGDSPWEKAVQLAAASGLVLYVDRLGIFCTSPGLDPNAQAVWLFDEGPNCTFADVPTIDKGTGQPVPNGFIVRGNSNGGSSSGIRGEAWDEDPKSPTYRYGRYGENVEVVETDKVRNNTQAQAAAELLLRRALGRSVEFSFSGVPVPHLDPYDIVWARRRQVGVDESFFLSSYDIPLAVTDAAGGALGRHLSNADAATTERIESLLGTDTSVT